MFNSNITNVQRRKNSIRLKYDFAIFERFSASPRLRFSTSRNRGDYFPYLRRPFLSDTAAINILSYENTLLFPTHEVLCARVSVRRVERLLGVL